MTSKPYFKPVSLEVHAGLWLVGCLVLGALASMATWLSAAPWWFGLLPWLFVAWSWRSLNAQHQSRMHFRTDGTLHVQTVSAVQPKLMQSSPKPAQLSEHMQANVVQAFVLGRLLYTAYQLPNQPKQSMWWWLKPDEEHAIRCWCRMQQHPSTHSNHS